MGAERRAGGLGKRVAGRQGVEGVDGLHQGGAQGERPLQWDI